MDAAGVCRLQGISISMVSSPAACPLDVICIAVFISASVTAKRLLFLLRATGAVLRKKKEFSRERDAAFCGDPGRNFYTQVPLVSAVAVIQPVGRPHTCV